MSKKVTIKTLGKQWDDYATACQTLFTPPNLALVADAAELPHSREDIVLAAKLMIFIAPRIAEDDDIAGTVRTWLRFLPHFISSPQSVSDLNTAWRAVLDGDKGAEGFTASSLPSFFADVKNARRKLNDEIDLFLNRSTIIPTEDPLALHKACILLNVEYDSPNPPLGKTILKVLFPHFV